jgi:hypothetical protein
MRAIINMVTLNLQNGKASTIFQINSNSPEMVMSKGITEQLEGNIKNLSFIINYAKDKNYEDIEIHAVAPTSKQELSGVVLPNFQEQTKMYMDGTYKGDSSFTKELSKAISRVKSSENSISFEVDLSKEDGLKLTNGLRKVKEETPDRYNERLHISDSKPKEVKTVAFKNSYIPENLKRENTAPDFKKVKAMQKREQERAERWKDQPFAVEVYNDKEEKQPILLCGANVLGSLQEACYLADWWEQVEKRNVIRVGDELNKLKGYYDLSKDMDKAGADYLYEIYVRQCKRENNIVNSVLDIDIDILLNKSISDRSFFDNTTEEERDAFINKVYSLNYQIIHDFGGAGTDPSKYLFKVAKSDASMAECVYFNKRVYTIEELMELQREKNLFTNNGFDLVIDNELEPLEETSKKEPVVSTPTVTSNQSYNAPVSSPKPKKKNFSLRNRNADGTLSSFKNSKIDTSKQEVTKKEHEDERENQLNAHDYNYEEDASQLSMF